MSKKILLLSSVIFLSSCGNNISQLGDKFLDLINPSDAATEQVSLSGDETLVAVDEYGDASISEIEKLKSLSDDALIEMALAKGIDFDLDADGNLSNRDDLIKTLLENSATLAALISEFENNGGSFILYFSYDDTEIDEVSTRTIIEHANFMQDNPSLRLRLEGHADERGTREYNLALGENRALSVKVVLSLYNLDSRIVVVSYGEESPILVGSNEVAWQENRRVEFSYY
jgi:peptidoglycan-associated lipoprotein